MPARQPISPGLNRIRRIVPPLSVDSTHVRTPCRPSPGSQAHMPAGGARDHAGAAFDFDFRLHRTPSRIRGTAAHRWNMRPGAAVQYA